MSTDGLRVLAALVGLIALPAGAAETSAEEGIRPEPDLERGRALYRERCAICHGRTGLGDGPIARFIDPIPRDFTTGVYKLRSTPTGELPTDDDLFGTITRGIRGTAMPGWSGLPAADRWQLVYYVQSFSTVFAEWERVDSIEIPEPPPATPESIARGAEVYVELECVECHGVDGRGDGEGSNRLTDDAGDPIYPYDMTRGYLLKGGQTAQDVYRTFHTGLDGTPMPSFRQTIAEGDSWPLVHYVLSLRIDEE